MKLKYGDTENVAIPQLILSSTFFELPSLQISLQFVVLYLC